MVRPPRRVGGRQVFCSRAIPGPGPSQNPALCGSPPTKCRTFGGCLFVEVVARAGVWWGVERPAASGTPYRTTKKTSARFAHYRSSPLSCTPRWVALLQGKPRCGLCQYNCSSRLSGEPVSPLPQYTTLLWSLRALDYCRTFRQLFEAVKKTVSNQG